MAKTPKQPHTSMLGRADEPKDSKSAKASSEDIAKECVKNYETAITAEQTDRLLALEDMRFCYEEEGQWTQDAKQKREGRPCYSFNRVIQVVDQIVGDQRQNRPGIKTRAVNNGTSAEMSDTFTGLIRNIESISDADSAYDWAFEGAVSSGRGAWRITTEYADEDGFDQDIFIRPITNPFTVYFDPNAQDFQKRDAKWCVVSEMISKEDFEEQYPDADISGFDSRSVGEALEAWYKKDAIRIAEYFKKIPITKTICMLSDGRVVEEKELKAALQPQAGQPQVTCERTRTVKTHKVIWYKCSALEVLEGPKDWAGKYIPIVGCYGKRVNLEGEEKTRGVIRFAKDAQRTYNYNRSTAIEAVALTPKAPYMVTAAMIKGYEAQWKNAHKKNYPFLYYNADPDAVGSGGMPSRQTPPTVQEGMRAEVELSAQDIQATTGYYNPSLGALSQERSGVALEAQKREGDTGSFAYIDNLSKALKYTGEILVDLIPKIYDSERQVRILGPDGTEKFVQINQTVIDPKSGGEIIVNDLSQGKFDVAVTTGPSYQTKRQEAAAQLLDLIKVDPEIAGSVADILVKWLDIPGSDELAERFRILAIKQGIIAPTPEDMKNMPPPDPQAQKAAQLELLLKSGDLHEQIAGIARKESEARLNQGRLAQLVEEAVKTHIEARLAAGALALPQPVAADVAIVAPPAAPTAPVP